MLVPSQTWRLLYVDDLVGTGVELFREQSEMRCHFGDHVATTTRVNRPPAHDRARTDCTCLHRLRPTWTRLNWHHSRSIPVSATKGAFQRSRLVPATPGYGAVAKSALSAACYRRWHFGQKCEERCATTMRRTGVPQAVHASPVR
jgi:hypothetical protein